MKNNAGKITVAALVCLATISLGIVAMNQAVAQTGTTTRTVTVNTNGVVVGPTNFWPSNSAAILSSLNLGSAATNSSTNFATAAQGVKADSALQPGASYTNISGLGSAATNSATNFVASSANMTTWGGISPTAWAIGLLSQTGRTTFSNTNYSASATDRYIAQVGTMSAPRTLTLPAASSVPAGTAITIRDESGTVTRTNYITITRSGSDTLSTTTISGAQSASTITYDNDSVAVRFYSDGVSKWIADDAISAGLLHFPFALNGQPSTGVVWGTHGANALSSMAGSITMDGSVGGHNEIRYSAPRQAIVTSLFSASDVGYLQIGNNGWDGMYMFLSSQGTSTANRTTIPSAPLVFKVNYWTGSAASYRTPTIRGEIDSSGNPRLSIYAAGYTSAGGDVSTTWDANYNGTGNAGRVFNPGTETTRFTTGGIDLLSGKISGLASGSNINPSITGASSSTTGLGFFGPEFQLIRNSNLLAYSDATYGLVIADILTCNGRVGLSAGTASFNAIHRTADTTTGMYFPATKQMAVSANGTEIQRWTYQGTQIGGGNGTAMSLVVSATATLDFSSISAQSSADLTITATGAAVGDVVTIGLPSGPSSGLAFNAFVSSSNTVTVRAHNYTGSPIDPASATFRVQVTKF